MRLLSIWAAIPAGVLLVVGCKASAPQRQEDPPAEPPAAAAAPASSGKVASFGDPISSAEASKLSDVLANPRTFEGKTVTVEGEVRRVCKKMGCWMELATAKDDTAPGCRVFFGAHQFFVPTDSDGSHARVRGEVQLQPVPAKFVEHLEQEGAEFKAKNADGTADEVRLVATGVELTRS